MNKKQQQSRTHSEELNKDLHELTSNSSYCENITKIKIPNLSLIKQNSNDQMHTMRTVSQKEEILKQEIDVKIKGSDSPLSAKTSVVKFK